MEKILAIKNEKHILEAAGSLLFSHTPKERYVPSQKKIRSLEIAFEKKVNDKK